MLKFVKLILVAACLASPVFADAGADKRLDVIVHGLDHADQIKSLRVLPGGSVDLPVGSIGASELAANSRELVPDVIATSAQTSRTVAVTIYAEDTAGLRISNRTPITVWMAATADGAPAAGVATGVVQATVGSVLVVDTANVLVRGLTDTGGVLVLTSAYPTGYTNFIHAAIGGRTDNASVIKDGAL